MTETSVSFRYVDQGTVELTPPPNPCDLQIIEFIGHEWTIDRKAEAIAKIKQQPFY